jgi:hypothetical protein
MCRMLSSKRGSILQQLQLSSIPTREEFIGVLTVIKSRSIRWTRYAAYTAEIQNARRILNENHKRTAHWEDLSVQEMVILDYIEGITQNSVSTK